MTFIQLNPFGSHDATHQAHECPHRGAVRFRRGQGNSAASDRYFPVEIREALAVTKKTRITVFLEILHWCGILFSEQYDCNECLIMYVKCVYTNARMQWLGYSPRVSVITWNPKDNAKLCAAIWFGSRWCFLVCYFGVMGYLLSSNKSWHHWGATTSDQPAAIPNGHKDAFPCGYSKL